MARAKGKELPHFSKLLKIISEHQKNYGSDLKNDYWSNDVEVLNSLTSVLVSDTYPELEKWWFNKGHYGSSEATNFKNIDGNSKKKFLPSIIWKYYSGSVLASKELSYQDHIERLSKKICTAGEEPHFLTKSFCKDIFDYFYKYSQVASIGDMNLNSLELEIRSGNYGKFLATVLFFIAADMPEANGRQIDSTPIMESAKEFFSDILKDLEKGNYFNNYHLEVILTPRIEKRVIICETITISEAPSLNMDREEDGLFSLSFYFNRKDSVDIHNIESFMINGRNLTSQIETTKLPDRIKGTLLYGKKYIIDGIDKSDYYYIERVTKSQLSYPVGRANYRLNFASKRLVIKVYISDIYQQSKALFNIYCSLFAPFSQEKRLSMIDSDSKSFTFIYEGFVPKGTGVSILIRPLDTDINFEPIISLSSGSRKSEPEHTLATQNILKFGSFYGFGGGDGEEEEE